MSISLENQDNIVLFAFRTSQKLFFETLLENCKDKNLTILSTKNSFKLSFKALGKLKDVNLNDACDFAVDEFYAKTNLKIPKIFLKIYFKLFSYINFMRYYAALDEKYTKMLIWNGGKFRQRIALEVTKIKKIKVYFFENGLLPNTIVFDNKGINYENSVPRNQDFYKSYSSNIALPTELVPRIGKSREVFTGEKEILPKKYIFVPFQVDYDTQIISNSHWIKNMRMLFDVIENVAQKSEYHFVLKEHPSSGVEYLDLYTRVNNIENISFKNTYSTQELIEKSLAVITINSTVGIESLLFHKKVIVLGDAFYNIESLTHEARCVEDLLSIVEVIESIKIDIDIIDNFLKYLYNDYLIPKDDESYKIICQKLVEKKEK